MAKSKRNEPESSSNEQNAERPRCGLVMPISAMGDYSAQHWSEVKTIILDSLAKSFDVSMVSEGVEVGVIHSRIVNSLAEMPVVVCDVSGMNPNVMFELGLRLAFDMPTVLIKDDVTKFNFDTMPIEHLVYSAHLRHPNIETFKHALQAKTLATYQRKIDDQNYSCFLRHFTNYVARTIPTEQVESFEALRRDLALVLQYVSSPRSELSSRPSKLEYLGFKDLAEFLARLANRSTSNNSKEFLFNCINSFLGAVAESLVKHDTDAHVFNAGCAANSLVQVLDMTEADQIAFNQLLPANIVKARILAST